MLKPKWLEIIAVIMGIFFIAGIGIFVRCSEILNVSEGDTSQTSAIEETTIEEFTTAIDTEIKIEETTILVEEETMPVETKEEIVIKTPMTNLMVSGDRIFVNGEEKISVFWIWNTLRGCKCPYFKKDTTNFCENIEDCDTIWDKATCAAIMGNMEHECGLYKDYWFNSEIYGGGGGVFYGLCQWKPSRIKTAKEALGITSINPTAEEQIKILCWELTTNYFKNLGITDILFEGCTCTSADKCQCAKRIARSFCIIFEAPGNEGVSRQEKAQEWFEFFQTKLHIFKLDIASIMNGIFAIPNKKCFGYFYYQN